MEQFQRGIIESGTAAYRASQPAELAFTTAQASGVGGNRLDPEGPFDSEIGLVAVQSESEHRLIALVVVYGMHPTVLHEDSRLVSSDFPHFARQRLKQQYPELVTLYNLGPCGNLSTRYHVKSQTFAEAQRLGERLGDLILSALAKLKNTNFSREIQLSAKRTYTDLPTNSFQSTAAAQEKLQQATERYEKLKREGAPHGPLRTAECEVFGCEEALTLAEAQATGELAKWQERYRQAEVQVFRLGDVFIVAWPGEQFVEHGLALKQKASQRVLVISLANGELQGYIATPEAEAAGAYEAAFALFKPKAGDCLVNAALKLINQLV